MDCFQGYRALIAQLFEKLLMKDCPSNVFGERACQVQAELLSIGQDALLVFDFINALQFLDYSIINFPRLLEWLVLSPPLLTFNGLFSSKSSELYSSSSLSSLSITHIKYPFTYTSAPCQSCAQDFPPYLPHSPFQLYQQISCQITKARWLSQISFLNVFKILSLV
ncbi:hypothetical protein FGO68_gene1315 [Halteria grandinella]|uniref:Uncharacterized protein n=1 Tax=Halteria grandinella TaxID=5974 RepID=A0A8J8NCL0_HALGN|nr:hypothetical protein FGO68_gene1315 [Halteria grandinella]